MTYPDYGFYREVFGGSEEEEVIMPFIRKGADILGGYIMGCELSDNDDTEFSGRFALRGNLWRKMRDFPR